MKYPYRFTTVRKNLNKRPCNPLLQNDDNKYRNNIFVIVLKAPYT